MRDRLEDLERQGIESVSRMERGVGMIGFRGLSWLTLVVTLAACIADAPEPSPESASPVTREAESVTAGGESLALPPEVPPDAETLTADGWGPLRIGMSRAEITAVAGEDADPRAVGGPDPARCDEFRPANAPEGILVMVENGVLTRISVSRDPNIRTSEGLRIGDPESSVLAEYGSRAKVDSHQYVDPPAKYITVWREPPSAANPRGIRYEVDSNGTIAHLRAGGPSIEYVEGCL